MGTKRKRRGMLAKAKEKLEMYDMIIANLIAGNSVIEPDRKLDKAGIDIGFSNIASATHITKYFIIKSLPDWLKPHFMDTIRNKCITGGVKINFYMYGEPHTINWDSQDMQNRLKVYRDYASENSSDGSAFEYRKRRDSILARERIITSTKYLNEAELDHKRTLAKVSFIIEVTALRNDRAVTNMMYTIRNLKKHCAIEGIKIAEMKVNMIDWLQYTGILSLKETREAAKKISKSFSRRVLTDDIIANLGSYKQGKVGHSGVPVGIDVNSKVPVLYKFKDDPDKVENWLVSAMSGAGKSWFVKVILTWLLGEGFVVTIMDYEGDEYSNLAAYVRQANPEDVKVISMGKGSTVYFDPMEIPLLTGDSEIDSDLKETAITYTLGIFRLIVAGINKQLTKWEDSVISAAIRRVYEQNGVTDEPYTWKLSQGLTVAMVYDEIVNIVESREFMDEATENIKHRAAVEVMESCRVYFEEGEAKASTFKHPMSVNELYKANLIIFSFGMKGATDSQTDPVVLALKQLSVANISIQISNYCKYIRRCFNVKVWEEYQRWGEAAGSAEIIGNAMTGGRKRGDVNFIITNDLAAILDESNPINEKLSQNISSYAIGAIKKKAVRAKFCKEFDLEDISGDIELIAKANTGRSDAKSRVKTKGGKYTHAFCLVMDNGKKAVVKQSLPKALEESSLFKTGVSVDKQ